jgi:phosphatidate cytidylyltransferase
VKNLLTRTLTGILFVAVVVGAIYLHPLSSAALFLVIAILGYIELIRLVNHDITRIFLLPGLITGIMIYAIILLVSMGILPFYGMSLIIPVLFIAPLYEWISGRKPTNKSTTAEWAAIFYVFIPFSLSNFLLDVRLPGFEHEPFRLVSVLILVWANDVFAYLGGIIYGRHKLAPVISPSKTWEGTLTGIVAAIVAGIIFSRFDNYLLLPEWIILALIVAVAGILGDLGESRLKRSIRAKDSGNLLPGHGGILDRFDAFLFAIPAALIYLEIITS